METKKKPEKPPEDLFYQILKGAMTALLIKFGSEAILKLLGFLGKWLINILTK